MEYLLDLIQQLHHMGPEMLLGLSMIGLSYGLRFIPVFPNVWIPAVCIFAPMFIQPLIADPSRLTNFPHYPVVRFALEGLLIGVVAWMFHNKAIKKLEDKFLAKRRGRRAVATTP
jgi:hypothetical protein